MADFYVSEGFGPEIGSGGQAVRLGLMGGTFDPVHLGHLACARAVRDACGIEKILFLPTGVPNFKRDRKIAPGDVRLDWCKLALSEDDCFGVCDIELRRGGITYTVDTLRELRGLYPANVELCFIVGADSAASLPRWRESATLADLATFVAVSRPGQALDRTLRTALSDAGFELEYVEGLACDISSSDIRTRLAAGKSVEGLVPEAIRVLVEAEPTYRALALIEGEGSAISPDGREGACPLSEAFFEARAVELSSRVSEKRLRHTLGVVEAASYLARVYGVDESKARLAALLHDWDKGYDDEGMRQRVAELGMIDDVDAWVLENAPYVLHGNTAACFLSREFPEIPADVIQAIDRHTVAAVDMSDLDMVLYIADAIEDGRQFGRIDELRSAVGEVDLEELFFLTYEYWVFLLFERRKQLHPDTITIWNTLVARRAAKKGN